MPSEKTLSRVEGRDMSHDEQRREVLFTTTMMTAISEQPGECKRTRMALLTYSEMLIQLLDAERAA